MALGSRDAPSAAVPDTLDGGAEFLLLGQLAVHGPGGYPCQVPGARLRGLLALLALDAGRMVTTDRLIASLWEDTPPANAANALQSLVSRLRRALPAELHAPIESEPAGYRLAVDPARVDAHRFAALAETGRRELARGDAAPAAGTLRTALALWRGPALAGLADLEFARGQAARLAELRLAALEDRIGADLALGEYGGLVAELEQLTTAYPLRERLGAALMRALAGTGRQAEALAVYERIKGLLADELGVDPSAELVSAHLAVLRGEVGVAQTGHGGAAGNVPGNGSATYGSAPGGAVRDGSVRDTPAPTGVTGHHMRPAEPARERGASRHRAGLPATLTSFVGREGALATVGAQLADTRLVTLIGPGGAGKTRLAIQLATVAGEKVPDRVWFVQLAPVRDPAEVPRAVFDVLGIREQWLVANGTVLTPSTVDLWDMLLDMLSGEPALLVLDNCEHVIGAAAALTERLLGTCRDLHVLTTSREPLGIVGERLWPVPPLDVPPADVSVADAGGYPAVELLVDRALAVRPGFAVDEHNVAAIAQICRRLDGMPLAIELAAARLRAMSPEVIAERLDDRFALLTAGARTALPRHQTLRAVVEWSWDLLTEPERILARRLSVFAGGATLTAVEQVCGGSGLPEASVFGALAGLVDKSLVEMDPAGADGELRYRMLETMRAYGAERLAEAGEDATLRGRHAWHFLDLAVRADAMQFTRDQLVWLARLDGDQDNLLSALRWAVGGGHVELALRLYRGLIWYWILRGRDRESRTWGREVVGLAGDTAPPGLAEAYAGAWIAAQVDDEVDVEDADHAFAVATRLRDERAGEFTSPVSWLLDIVPPMLAGDHDRALARIEELQREQDPWLAAMGYLAEAAIRVNLGRPAETDRAFGEALRRLRAIGERFGISMALMLSAEPMEQRGELGAAIDAVRESIALGEEINHDIPVQALFRLAVLKAKAGDHDRAVADAREAVARAEQSGNRQMEVFCRFSLVEILDRAGRGDEAAAEMEHIDRTGVPTHGGPGPRLDQIGLPMARARLALRAGDPAGAIELLRGTVTPARATADRPVLARVVDQLARAELAAGDAERAAVLFGASRMLAGVPDDGDPEVVAARDEAAAALGTERYAACLGRGTAFGPDDLSRYIEELPGPATG